MKRTRKNNMNRRTLAALYEQYIPLANRMAGKFARTYRLPVAELQEEALSIWAVTVCEWPYRFDSAKSSTISWAYRQLHWNLLDYCTRKALREVTFTKLLKDQTHQAPTAMPCRRSWLASLLHTLSEDAKLVVDTILFAPAELADDISAVGYTTTKRWVDPTDTTRHAVQDYLEDCLNWPMGRVANAWTEIQTALGTT